MERPRASDRQKEGAQTPSYDPSYLQIIAEAGKSSGADKAVIPLEPIDWNHAH